MRGLQKSKRVCWATDGNLCQVKLFLSEDSPSVVGIGTQDHLQPKKKSAHLYNTGSVASVPDDGLPPGFEGVNPETQLLKNKLTQIPLAKWKCPPRFVMDPSWRVIAGEENAEVEIQNQRELRVLEAIYPRPSAIPPNPTVSLDAEGIVCDDSRTPLVPITPIEEEDASEEPLNDSAFSAQGMPPSSQYAVASSSAPNPLPNGRVEDSATQPQLLAAASAALSAMVSGTSSGSERLIDHDLLVKLLNNPAILEEFMKRQGNSSSHPPQVTPKQPTPAPPPAPPIVPMSNPPPSHFNPVANPKEAFYPPMNGKLPVSSYQHAPTIPSTAPPRDMNYYKSLIQQHGGDRQQQQEITTPPPFMGHHSHHTGGSGGPNPDPVDSNSSSSNNNNNNRLVRGEARPKFNKPCLYFNSAKGCRHGANCAYQHDSSLQQRASSIPEMQSAKRMKMGRDMRGSQSYS